MHEPIPTELWRKLDPLSRQRRFATAMPLLPMMPLMPLVPMFPNLSNVASMNECTGLMPSVPEDAEAEAAYKELSDLSVPYLTYPWKDPSTGQKL